jgi:hypothetical protein
MCKNNFKKAFLLFFGIKEVNTVINNLKSEGRNCLGVPAEIRLRPAYFKPVIL